MPAPSQAPQGGDPSQQQDPAQQQQGGGGSSPASQAVQMIQQGYAMLGKLIQSAGGQLPPDDIKLYQAAAQATDALLQSLTSPAQGQGSPQQSQKAPPGGPMAANANAGAKQVGPQG